jgi:multicomponent Na+:H+ antiporter subunit D
MSGGDLILLTLAIPLACALAILALAKAPDVRETVTMLSALALAACCLALAARTGAGAAPALTLAEPLPGIGIAFRLEHMGALFAAMASCLWAVNSLYSIGYMRSVHAANQTRFYACFALALFAAVGAAMAANLFTLFIFYEILTLSTYPLVAHAGDARARRGARIYLITLIGASVGLLLPGVVAVQSLAGSTSFVPGGVLVAATEPAAAGVVLALVFLGCAKAALFPLHFWLPAAMVAPTPVSALLHAVAVVKMGVFVLLKVATYTFGPGLLAGLPAREFLLWVAGFTVVGAGVVALTRDDLKSRLAWSTVSQLGVIAMAALIATASSLLGGVLLMLSHALAKITLFFCAGAIYVATGLTRVSPVAT